MAEPRSSSLQPGDGRHGVIHVQELTVKSGGALAGTAAYAAWYVEDLRSLSVANATKTQIPLRAENHE